MKTIIAAFTLFASSAFGQSVAVGASSPTETSFKAEKIDPSDLVALKAADAELSKAASALVVAQGIAAEAKAKYDAAKAKITAAYGPFEGACSFASGYDLVRSVSSRAYRRVDIRGGYALISGGVEACQTSTYAISNNGVWTPN